MPGPGLFALVATPLALSLLLAVGLRGRFVSAAPVRGLSVVPVVVVASFAAAQLQGVVPVSDAVLNRLLAGTILVAAGTFVALNRRQPSGLVRWGGFLSAAGAASNALATLVYGFMPVLASSANADGGDLAAGSHPDPQYVAVDSSHWFAVLLGDVIPVPQLDAVVSLGDLLLVPGCTILLAAFLTPLVPSRGQHALAPTSPSLARLTEQRG